MFKAGTNPRSRVGTDALVKVNNQRRIPDQDVFVENSTYARHKLKERIQRQGLIPNSCGICNIEPTWQGKTLVLVLDHINGINNDNRIENLRLICSNCDSQLDTYKSRNRIRKANPTVGDGT